MLVSEGLTAMGSILIQMTCAATWGHGDIQAGLASGDRV